MAEVVQATCPGCKAVLRIPAEWLGRSFRCKHCKTVIHAKAKASGPVRAARPAAPAAPPAPPPTADAFAFDDDSASPTSKYRARRRRSSGSRAKLLIILAVLLGLAGGGAFVAWPHLKPLLDKSGGVADGGDDPLAGKKGGKRSDGSDLPANAGPFPRRALVVSINNYLYANPINHGLALGRARNVSTFLEQLNRGLRVPRDQIAELSDAALKDARPTVAPVIRATVSGFLEASRPQDRVLLFAIGHVVEADGEAFLVPADGDFDVKESLIPLKWFYDALAACKARQKVFVLDTCRLNPARGQERPGSGPMGEKLDALLKAPPAGVQVWTACVKDQYSYEFEDGETHNGLFLDELHEVLSNAGQGQIQKPGDALPLERLVEDVNRRMKEKLAPLGKEQTSRLTGAAAEDGAAYDATEPAPAKPELAKAPAKAGGALDVAHVKAILTDISFPPLKVSKDETALTAEALPPFSRDAMLPYLADDKAKTPLREEVEKARDTLNALAKSQVLREGYRAPGDYESFKKVVLNDQKESSKLFVQLGETLDAMEAAKEHRKDETKRWQATYDYILARLKAQKAYLLEYQALLGQLRNALPARDPKVHNGWRLASQRDPEGGDNEAKKLAVEARKLLDKIIKDNPDTPWAVVAKRDKASALGLEWQPTK